MVYSVHVVLPIRFFRKCFQIKKQGKINVEKYHLWIKMLIMYFLKV